MAFFVCCRASKKKLIIKKVLKRYTTAKLNGLFRLLNTNGQQQIDQTNTSTLHNKTAWWLFTRVVSFMNDPAQLNGSVKWTILYRSHFLNHIVHFGYIVQYLNFIFHIFFRLYFKFQIIWISTLIRKIISKNITFF